MKKIYIPIAILIIFGLSFWLLKDKNIENNMSEEKTNNTTEENLTEKDVVKVTMNTNLGDIELEMYPKEAPKTVDNFVKLAKEGFYDGTKFHRVISGFMIQGGDPLSKDESQRQFWGTGGPGYTFEDELNNVDLVAGVIAMANAGPDTNGSQFFIITAEATPWLQGKHTGFGKVVSGMDIVEKIENSEVGPTDQPLEDVEVTSVTISE